MYSLLQSLVTRNGHFQSQMYQILQTKNHPGDLYMVEEDCYEVVGDWKEEYKLECEAGNWRWTKMCANSRINYQVTCADSSNK